MRVLTLEVRPNRATRGNVDIVDPMSQAVLYSNTVANAKTYLINTWNLAAGYADRILQRGREVRGIWGGVRTFIPETNTLI